MKKNIIIISVIIIAILVGGFFLFNNYIYQEKQAEESLEEMSIPKVGFIPGQSDAITEFPKPGLATSITIDYSKCSKGSYTVYLGFGSTHFAFEGVKNDKCIFYYGGEIENPLWDGALPFRCSVSTSLGKKDYAVGDFSIQMEALDPYCSNLQN